MESCELDSGCEIYIPSSGLYAVITKPSVNSDSSKLHVMFSDGSCDIVNRDRITLTGRIYYSLINIITELKVSQKEKEEEDND